jgi:CRP-like cAMP-binding protein
MAGSGPFQNAVLSALDASSIERLGLRPVTLNAGEIVMRPEDIFGELLFLETGIASLTITFRDGSQVEAGVVGSDSMIGFESLLGQGFCRHHMVMQFDGAGFTCRLHNAQDEFGRFEKFHDLATGCMHAGYAHAAQLVGCNSKHEVMQRLSRWLLQCHDHSSNREISITHEMICNALGVSRSTVTMALSKLRVAGSVECLRGRIRIVDLIALRGTACECYDSMKLSNRMVEPIETRTAGFFAPSQRSSPGVSRGSIAIPNVSYREPTRASS